MLSKLKAIEDRFEALVSQLEDPATYGDAELLRRLLASQGDGEVTLIAVGFSTNLQRLMASGPDAVSSLDGMELIRRKVKHLYMMAGEFEQAEGKSAEYNIRIDRNAAQELFEKWPTRRRSPW